MNKKGNKYLPVIYVTVIVIIVSVAAVLIYKYFKKENFDENNNMQKALYLANYAGSRGIDLSAKPKLLKGVNNYPENFLQIQCPDGKCPGLGEGFDIRDKDLNNSSNFTVGKKIFKNLNIKDNKCFLYKKEKRISPVINVTKNSSELISSIAISNNLTGSAPIETVSVEATANTSTGSNVSEKENIQTAELSITDKFASVSIVNDKKCQFANLTEDFKSAIEKLSENSVRQPSELVAWVPYLNFFKIFGTHVMTQIVFGSKLQFWESIIDSNTNTEKILAIKACLRASDNLSGITAGVCSKYNTTDIETANNTTTQKMAYVLGGGDNINRIIAAKILNDKVATEEEISEFLKTSNQSNQSIGYIFTPIWDLIIQMYMPICINNYLKNIGDGSTECKITQLAINLEAAFAFKALECDKLTTSNGKTYQEFRAIKSEDSPIIHYGCFARKTGCRSASEDCHEGWKWGIIPTGCIAYGPSALTQGDEFKFGNGKFRTEVQGAIGSTDASKGINQSCKIGGAGCDCNYDWAGGLPDRYLWRTGDY